jgi:mannose-1-phosphate guanylyltransferase/phosphomannomutase
MELALSIHPGRSVAGPVTMPNAFDMIAERYKTTLLRISQNLHRLMFTVEQAGLLLVMDGTGNFIFPDFQPAVDGMMAAVRLLEYLAIRQTPVSQIVAGLPPVHMARDKVDCPWGAKGAIMRRLNERYTDRKVENIDGIKIHLNHEEWIHIAPDPEKPCFIVMAEGADNARAGQLIQEYRQQIEELVREG